LDNPVVATALGALLERPMHTYELSRVLGERGVPVNRASLYATVEAMAKAGWVRARETEQEGTRPRRTPYELTDAGREELIGLLDRQIRMPRREFPEFMGAVSHLGVLGRPRALDALKERAGHLDDQIAAAGQQLDSVLADGKVPRLWTIEAEYALRVAAAERDWIRETIDGIESGEIPWPRRRTKK
jgi:DNA-binding PadR family transcriptional regulator